jgi:hypothetical protein
MDTSAHPARSAPLPGGAASNGFLEIPMNRPLLRPSAAWLAALALALAGCASHTLNAVVVPEALNAPDDESRTFALLASGVEKWECRTPQARPEAPAWILVGPEATLSDESGHVVGRHGPGLAWESTDGSRIVGTVRRKVDAPVPGAMPWLLVETTNASVKRGAFTGVLHVQRVATSGGRAPEGGCTNATVGKTESVPFEAQFWFWSKRWNW